MEYGKEEGKRRRGKGEILNYYLLPLAFCLLPFAF
jgi:hypothetical protein